MKISTGILVSAIAILLLVSLSFLFRYQCVTAGDSSAYILDRWTGELRFVSGRYSSKVTERPIPSVQDSAHPQPPPGYENYVPAPEPKVPPK